MSQPFAHPSFLALPSYTQPTPTQTTTSTATSSASTPRGLHLPSSAGPPKKRKPNPGGKAKSGSKSGVNNSRELDERDDVKEDDLEEAPGGGPGVREIDDNYDEGEEEEGPAVEEEGEAGGAGASAGVGGSGGARNTGGRGAKKGAAAKMDIDVDVVKAKAQAMKGDQMALRNTLSPEDARRFDAFHSSVMPAKAMKKLLKDMYDQNLPEKSKLAQYLAGMAKIFVAEVVEVAKDLQPHTDHPTGPLKPYHLKLARQVLEERGLLGASTSRDTAVFRPKKPLFRR